jgi:hypothetical protein
MVGVAFSAVDRSAAGKVIFRLRRFDVQLAGAAG